jgi:hypothetical protein
MKFKAESQKRVGDERQIKVFGYENLEASVCQKGLMFS